MNRSVDDILKQYPYLGEDLQKAQKELNRYIALQQEARDPLKAQTLSDMPHMPAGNVSDQTYQAVEKLIDLYRAEIDKYTGEINELLELKKWLDKAFAELTEDERRIVYQYYDRRISINKLAYTLHCDRRKIYRILDDAKTKIRRIV